ncbi:hypothetical protein Tco_0890214 [Tanacetum coccineum]|uniref:Uncharacterized protein n=1 Tax=Tanacetum coccineum TaxID=301880 RepID=A0ABQ5C2N2_9ASTR
MTTLADKAILSGADNCPPMLEKDMYDSWKSRMELYMMNRQHGRMILESVENGPLIWPTIEENIVTRPKKYSELSATKAIQADCDIKATNIILHGLPPDVYALVSNHKFAKELWERIQLLMQGTSLTKQERECKLYNEFDKFAYKKGETLRNFYLRFSLLLNDMNIYNMKLEQFQENIKFLNTLPPEWSKFVTDVKLVRDLHTNNIDQLHAYLAQHEFHANESQQYSFNQSSTPLLITHPSNDYHSLVHHNAYSPPSSIPQIEYAPTVNQQQQQPKFPLLDLGLTVPMSSHLVILPPTINLGISQTLGNKLPLIMAELLFNQFRGDKFLLLRVQVEPTLQEQVEAILGNKGLLFVTTVKGKATCPNSALNLRGKGMILALPGYKQFLLLPDLRVLQFGIRAKVMATPTILVSAERNLRDPIDIKMDIIHPEPVVVVAFPAATVVRTLAQHGEAIRGIQEQLVVVPIQEELMALRFRIDIAEAKIASLRARNKTTEAIEKITRNRERQAREKMERQLSLIQEELESLRRLRRP